MAFSQGAIGLLLGPAPVDPGNLKRDGVGKERLIYKQRLGENSVVGKLVEKSG